MTNQDCKSCGQCCKAIYLPLSFEEIRDIATKDKTNKDAIYISKNWNEITIEEAKKINPYFFKKYEKESIKIHEKHFFVCNSFNSETNKCGDYENRPHVCRGFPFYPHKLNIHNKLIDGELKLIPDYSLYSEDCVFHKALATEEEWNKSNKIAKL